MKKCKYCQSDIAENAKNCPNCGKRQGKGKIIAIIIIVVLILFAISSGGSDEPKSNDGKNNSSKSKPVYETTECKKKIGSLDPYEECTCLYEMPSFKVVLYNITGKSIMKVGFIKED